MKTITFIIACITGFFVAPQTAAMHERLIQVLPLIVIFLVIAIVQDWRDAKRKTETKAK